MINKPYRPWYDDTKDYNTNAPTYYDYLANEINLEKVQTDAINDLLVRDVDFKDSDEVHVDKLTDWHSDDNSEHAKITFKAHVISSPSSATQTIDGVEYVTSNGIKVLHDGLYAPDYKKVLEKYSADTNSKITKVTNDINTINTKLPYKENKVESSRKTITVTHGEEGTSATTKVDTNPQKVLEHDNLKVGEKLVKTHNESSNDTTISLDRNFISQVNKATSDVSGKQDKLTTSGGIDLTNNNLTLKTYPTYGSDLNTLTETCIVNPNSQTTNLPTDASADGVLLSYVVSDVAVQYYVPYNNKNLYVRSGVKVSSTPTWTQWQTILNLTSLNDVIKTFNKSTNLQNPDIYNYHEFSNVTTEGKWGFEFFNDTNAKIYNVKIKVGIITKAEEGSIIAQQSVSALLKAGVPQDFINKAKNGYVFRSGYYLGDSLNRVAFELKTEDELINLKVKYYDTKGTLNNVQVVQGHECSPVAVAYNNPVSIEETDELKPVVDSTDA